MKPTMEEVRDNMTIALAELRHGPSEAKEALRECLRLAESAGPLAEALRALADGAKNSGYLGRLPAVTALVETARAALARYDAKE